MNSTFFAIIILFIAAIVAVFWPQLRTGASRRHILPLSILAVIACAMLYLQTGAPFLSEKITDYRSESQKGQQRIVELEARLNQKSVTISELAELGALYQKQQAYVEAAEIYRQAVLQSGGDPQLILAYGKALMMAAGGRVTDDAKQAFTMAAARMPSNPEPLFFLAIHKAQNGKEEEAREGLRTLAEAYPQAAGLQRAIAEELARMEKRQQ